MFQVYPTHKVTEQFRELGREIEARLNGLEGITTEAIVTAIEPQTAEAIING
jgi:hypothetical protein